MLDDAGNNRLNRLAIAEARKLLTLLANDGVGCRPCLQNAMETLGNALSKQCDYHPRP